MKLNPENKSCIPVSRSRGGFAMVAVLLVLLALFALSAPFLMTARNADKSSAQMVDRASARLALDTALRHARAGLGASHPAVDSTPYFDTPEELAVTNRFAEDFYDPEDPRGVMWGLEVEDLAGRIDLNSASPHVIANLLGGVARLGEDLEKGAKVLEVNSAAGFAPAGFLWLEDELIGYTGVQGPQLGGLVRGLAGGVDGDGEAFDCGPGPAEGHALGSYVLDQRMFSLARWRMANRRGEHLAEFDAIEQVGEAAAYSMVESLPRETLGILERSTTVHGGVASGATWQHPTRVLKQPTGEPAHGCSLRVEDARFFNPGTTVKVTDGERTEFGIVREVWRTRIELMESLVNEYEPNRLIVSALVRQPVNINTATPEVLFALIVNVKLRHKSARITAREARQLVGVIAESRPFVDFEDFVRRVILPSAGFEPLPADAPAVPEVFRSARQFGELNARSSKDLVGFIDQDDARALYRNARNANDNELGFSTMPFSFTSRDLYALELRASVNAKSGVERSRAVREEIDLIVPQGNLLRVWSRQSDFDEDPRLDRAAPGWLTGPNPTSRPESVFASRFPSRVRAHLGPHEARPEKDGVRLMQPAGGSGSPGATGASGDASGAEVEPVLTFAASETEGEGWAQPAPARTDERGLREGRVLHFDDEAEGFEGRYLPDGTVRYAVDDDVVRWAGSIVRAKRSASGARSSTASGTTTAAGSSSGAGGAGLMNPISFEMWVKPRDLQPGALFLDGSGRFTDSDRVSLLFEDGDLVLRVLDGATDHPRTTFEERAEVRYSLNGGGTNGGAGMPVDVWTHVEIGVTGTRPDQMRMLVDGRWAARTPGLTRLTSGLSPDSTSLPVESTAGFPDRCVLRIGEELIEATVSGPSAFSAVFQDAGESAGFGGRLAREIFQGADPGTNVGLATKQTAHASGTTVQLYGYSLPFTSIVPAGGGQLASDLGVFGVGRLVGVYDRTQPTGLGGRTIRVNIATVTGSQTYDVGRGLAGELQIVDGLILESADPDRSTQEMMQAFSPSGGYAAILAIERRLTASSGSSANRDEDGFFLGGIEVVRYSGWDKDRLLLEARGHLVPELRLLGTNTTAGIRPANERKTFVFHWYTDTVPQAATWNAALSEQVMVIPISVDVRGAASWRQPLFPDSEFLQITHTGADSHLTEWVRYDEIAGTHFVRDDPIFLLRALRASHAGKGSFVVSGGLNLPPGTTQPGNQPPNLPGGLPGNPTNQGSSRSQQMVAAASPAPPQPTPSTSRRAGAYWDHTIGTRELEPVDAPVSAAVASEFQFRGVLGTHPHAHTSGATVLPVWRTENRGLQGGLPGRFDHVSLFDEQVTNPSFPAVVQHAHRPNEYTTYAYIDNGTNNGKPSGALAGTPSSLSQFGFKISEIHVALDEELPVLFVPGAAAPQGGATASAGGGVPDARMLPRMSLFPSGELPRVLAGLRIGGGADGSGAVPAATVDEIVFGNDRLTHQFVLTRDISASDTQFEVKALREVDGDHARGTGLLRGLPPMGGLLRIGDEILAYQSLGGTGSTVQLAIGGRGLLGSDPQPHAAGEGAAYLEGYRVAILAGGMDAGQPFLPLVNHRGFPRSGTVLVDDELMHYTRFGEGGLEMPAASSIRGAMDQRGVGLFRGRYGTERADHASGTPVILHPIRYWDRWAEEADAPELDFFAFSIDQPGAYWRRLFWDVKPAPVGGARFQVLARLDPTVPWDSDPEKAEGLELFTNGNLANGGNPVNERSDHPEWRAALVYDSGAFDAVSGLSHGWKTTPRLMLFGAEYIAPPRVLRRVDR